MYSFRSLFQIASSRCRNCVLAFVWIVGISLKTHAGTLGNALPIKKLLGVNGSSSSMSLLTCVKGLALTRLSVSITMVERTSHVKFAGTKLKRRARFTTCSSPSGRGRRESSLSSFFFNSLGFVVSKMGSLFHFLYSIISFVSPRASLFSLFSIIRFELY